jgi:hypothetical protein
MRTWNGHGGSLYPGGNGGGGDVAAAACTHLEVDVAAACSNQIRYGNITCGGCSHLEMATAYIYRRMEAVSGMCIGGSDGGGSGMYQVGVAAATHHQVLQVGKLASGGK